jgi:hypothetical protein
MAGSSGAIRAGKAYYELYSENNPLISGLRQAETTVKASVSAIASRVGAIGASMAASVTAMIAAVASPAAALKLFASTGTELENMARRTGASAKALSSLEYAFKQTGSSGGALESTLATIRDKSMEAARGSDQAQLAFQRLGINFLALSTLKPEDQLRLVADRLNMIPNPAIRAAVAMDLLGSADLLPTFQRLRELEAEANKLGVTLSNDTSAAAKKFDETMTALWESLKQVGITIGETLAPAVEGLAKKAIELLLPVKEWIASHRSLVVTATELVVGLVALKVAMIAFSSVSWIATAATTALGVAMNLLPFVAIATALGLAGIAIVKLIEHLTGLKWSLGEVGRAVTQITAHFRKEWEKTLDWFAKRWIDVKEATGFMSGKESQIARNLPPAGQLTRELGGTPGSGVGPNILQAGVGGGGGMAQGLLDELKESGGGLLGMVGFPGAAKEGELSAAEKSMLGLDRKSKKPWGTRGPPGIPSALFRMEGIGAHDVRSKEGFAAIAQSMQMRQTPLEAAAQKELALQEEILRENRRTRIGVEKINTVKP